jgi:hypothetical protein
MSVRPGTKQHSAMRVRWLRARQHKNYVSRVETHGRKPTRPLSTGAGIARPGRCQQSSHISDGLLIKP